MREIKFRAWDKYKKMMVAPYDGDFIKWHAPSNWRDCYEVMQFTGLLDKNGKEIYEGDVCRFNAEEIGGAERPVIKGMVGVVKWDAEDAGFYYLTTTDVFPHVKPWFAKSVEVICNIYENLELLS